MQHPDDLRRAALARSPGAPWVTWYRVAPAGTEVAAVVARVELSNATLANWVAKTAGYLSEEFDIGAGSVVGLHLPLHWQLHVWAYGAWALGAAVACVGAADDIARGPAPLLAVGTDPMGLPLGSATPEGALDALADVRGYPDFFDCPPVAPDAAVIALGGRRLDANQVPALLPSGDVGTGGATSVITDAPDGPRALLAATVAAPARGQPTVLVDVSPASARHAEACASALARIGQQEGLTGRGELGTPRPD